MSEVFVSDHSKNMNMAALSGMRGSFDNRRIIPKKFDLTNHRMAAAGKITIPDNSMRQVRGSY